MRKAMLAFVLVGVLTLAASTLVGRAAPAGTCRTPTAPPPVTRTSAVAQGRGLMAAAEGGLVAIADSGAVQRFGPSGVHLGDVVRHVAARPGFGTAFVLDRRGADVVAIETPAGALRLPQPAEALHPAWSPDGDLVWSLGSSLQLRSHVDGAVRRIDPPPSSGFLFSPVFETPRRIVVVAAAPPTPAAPEDDVLDNLWSVDPSSGRWSAVTHFTTHGDRWSTIRTPVVVGPGILEFVRITGSGTATTLPSFSLWRLRDGAVTKIRALPDERYLADSDGVTRVWNVPDRITGNWWLVREDSNSRLRDVGCGAVMVDPLDRPDPDKEPAVTEPQPSHASTAGAASADGSEDPEVAILLGDFSSRGAADAAAEQIRGVYGADAHVEVADSTTAPGTIQPGVWATILRIPAGEDAGRALTEFRRRLPSYEAWSWVVTP